MTLKHVCAFILMIVSCGPVMAQSLFSPSILVNDSVITEFEIEQRQLFLSLLNAPGASREAVIEALIDDRLRTQGIASVGFAVSEETIEAGLEEFAGRVDLSAEEFIVVLEENGIAKETFENFVIIGVTWRDYIRARYVPRLQVTETEIDQALGSGRGTTDIRVLLSEIIIPVPAGREQEVEEVASAIAASGSQAEFSSFAREYSATATRENGGQLPWQPLSDLPAVLRPVILALAPGEVTEPIAIPDAVALFQLRGIQESGEVAESYAAIDYALYLIPGGRSERALAQAQSLRTEVDVCNDLYGIAKDQPPEILERVTKAPSEIPTDIALELSKLDIGESSVALTRNNGQTLIFLMLCGRTSVANEEADRTDVANALRGARLNAISESILDQLRADARIVIP
ncbi:MAG: peptidylprolyl isomerase [Pseudomonadota bacterium]